MLKTDIIRIKLNQMSRNPVIKEIVGKIEDGKKIIHRTNRENKISSSGYSYKMKWRIF